MCSLMGTTYAIASAKGGVGKTTTVANLGVALASTGRDVVVVDADIGMANLAETLGVDPDRATLHDVLHGTAALEDALYDGPQGVTVLPGSTALSDYRDANISGLPSVFEELEARFDTVIVDTGAGLSHDTALPLELADEVVLVSTPQPQSLGDTDKTRELVERLGGSVAGVVLTRAEPEASADGIDAEIIGYIPDDDAVDVAVVAGDPLVNAPETTPAGAAYRRLAVYLFDADLAIPGDPVSDAGRAGGSTGDADRSADEAAAGDDPTSEDELSTEDDPGTAADSDTEDVAEAPESADVETTSGEADTADPSDDATDDAVEADTGEDEAGVSAVESDDDGDATDGKRDDVDGGKQEDTDDGGPESVDDSEQENSPDADPAEEESIIEDAEPDDKGAPAGVGPVREKDVPVGEAEPDGDASTIRAPEEDSDADADSASSGSKSKGLLRRLLGR